MKRDKIMGMEVRCNSAVGMLITIDEYEKYAEILKVKNKDSKIIKKLYKIIKALDLSDMLEIELFEELGILIYIDWYFDVVESWPGVSDSSSYIIDKDLFETIEEFKRKASGTVLALKHPSFLTLITASY